MVVVRLNHILKTTDLVTRNNEKLHRQQSDGNGKKSNDFIDLPRDQGFTRPKVKLQLKSNLYCLLSHCVQNRCLRALWNIEEFIELNSSIMKLCKVFG